jgi:hypothetical protein
MALQLLSPPLLEPVPLPELKEFLRVDPGDSSQDTTITELALDARVFCETFTQRRFVQQTWRLLMDFFPGYIDMKLAGAKVSSPFVSGSNAVLVGIRYAIMLPYPPAQALVNFNYQNANGQVTSMITGPVNISAVSNVSGQPIIITTTTPHGLQSGASITIAGNVALLLALGGEASQVVIVLDANDLELSGPLGTGTSISATGTVTGYNFVQDLVSNPARLMPVFGQMWPVARVVANAVQVDYTVGYANPILVTVAASAVALTSSNYAFVSTDIGRPICIFTGGPGGGTLNTIIQAVTGGNATLRDQAATAVGGGNALLVNAAAGIAGHWSKIRRAIKVMTLDSYENRLPRKKIEDTVERILYPARDLRF